MMDENRNFNTSEDALRQLEWLCDVTAAVPA
jgi:hypothetical protein